MTTAASSNLSSLQTALPVRVAASNDTMWRQILRNRRAMVGGGILLLMLLLCVGTLPWTLHGEIPVYQRIDPNSVRHAPTFSFIGLFGYDSLGRSVFARCLIGGTISLSVGVAAATIAVVLGVLVGLIAGYRGGLVDSGLMRIVDILYGLPYILLVILFKVALDGPLTGMAWGKLLGILLLILAALLVLWTVVQPAHARLVPGVMAGVALLAALSCKVLVKAPLTDQAANLVVLFLAIGLVSWLTMSRVIRGQVLSLRGQPFIEACKALGLRQGRIFSRHILPNLVGPITVYATLTVPSAILQESFLSFLGVGVKVPLATWGSLASDGIDALSPIKFYWWQLIFPCALLAITLLSLNFMGDGLRDVFDPKKEAAKI
jgi:oligopeptide transport system permease protein